MNSVGSLVLTEYFAKPAAKSKNKSLSNQDFKELSKIFCHKILDTVSINTLLEISKARAYIEMIAGDWNTDYLKSLLIPLEKSANKAISERNHITEFLNIIRKRALSCSTTG